MIITEVRGDLFDAPELAIGHGVNCVGVMGAGVAKEVRRRYPTTYSLYRLHCEAGRLKPGDIQPVWEQDRYIINIASQRRPGPYARLEWIRRGIWESVLFLDAQSITSLAIPRIGCGIGGLNWETVRAGLAELETVRGFDLVVYSLDS